MLEGSPELGGEEGRTKGERSPSHLARRLCCPDCLGGRLLGKGEVLCEKPWV